MLEFLTKSSNKPYFTSLEVVFGLGNRCFQSFKEVLMNTFLLMVVFLTYFCVFPKSSLHLVYLIKNKD